MSKSLIASRRRNAGEKRKLSAANTVVGEEVERGALLRRRNRLERRAAAAGVVGVHASGRRCTWPSARALCCTSNRPRVKLRRSSA